MILIPEIKILEIIETAIKTVQIDFQENTDEKQSMLYFILGENTQGKYNFFEQAKDIFFRDNGHPRQIETRMMFDAQRAHLPTIHITMPSENAANDGIGVDEGYQESEINNGKITKTYTRGFETQYNAIITSDNSLEVLCIYHVLKSLLIGIFDTIEFNGIRNMKLSGQDLRIDSDSVPAHIFTRGIGINCFYEQTVPAVQKETFINSFKILYNFIENKTTLQ